MLIIMLDGRQDKNTIKLTDLCPSTVTDVGALLQTFCWSGALYSVIFIANCMAL